METPSLAHAIGLVIGIALIGTGLILIVRDTNLRPEEREQLREIKVLGFELRSSRAFLLVALGALLAITPPFIEAYLKSSQQNVSDLKSPLSIGKPPVATHDLTNIDPQEFEVRKDVRVFDLRSREDVPESRKAEKISRVLQTRYTLLKKIARTKYIRYRFATTGADVEARCLTHEYSASQLSDLKLQTVNQARDLTKILELRIDVSDEPVGEEFLIINEAHYWNAFQGEDVEWAGAITQYKTHELGLLLLFGNGNTYEHIAKYGTPGDSKAKKRFRGKDREYHSPQSLYWVIKEPEPNITYEIEWRWKEM